VLSFLLNKGFLKIAVPILKLFLLIKDFQWFAKALEKATNILSHCSDW